MCSTSVVIFPLSSQSPVVVLIWPATSVIALAMCVVVSADSIASASVFRACNGSSCRRQSDKAAICLTISIEKQKRHMLKMSTSRFMYVLISSTFDLKHVGNHHLGANDSPGNINNELHLFWLGITWYKEMFGHLYWKNRNDICWRCPRVDSCMS